MTRNLSYSAVRMFLECAKKYEYVYLERRPIPVSQALFMGGTMHVALAAYYQRRIDGKPVAESDCDTFFAEALQSQVFLQRVGSAQGVARGIQPLNIEQQDAIALLRSYLRWAEKAGLKPVFVERDLSRTVDGIPVTGRIDVMDSTGIVIDWKTPAKPWESEKIQNDMQPLFYALLLGRPIEFHYHFLIKQPSPQIKWARRTISQQAIGWMTREFLPPVWKAMQCGDYPYADPASRTCNEECCEYWPVCKGGALRQV